MRVFFTERAFRRALIAVALAGLFSGAAAWANGRSDLASWCWAADTVPVVVGLLLSMVRFGSKADIAAPPINVRFTPQSRHSAVRLRAVMNQVINAI